MGKDEGASILYFGTSRSVVVADSADGAGERQPSPSGMAELRRSMARTLPSPLAAELSRLSLALEHLLDSPQAALDRLLHHRQRSVI